jgi:hypothetical protein
MTMSKHFSYLTQNDEADFFQKVANEQAESRMPVASVPIIKTAMKNLLEGVTFDKVASRIDRDIHILKTAGAYGMNLGMQKRAGAYIDQLYDQCEMTPEEFGQLFDKVASEAILADMAAAREHLESISDPGAMAWVDGELAKIGRDLTEGALMEKDAFLGLARAGLAGLGRLIGTGARSAGRGALTVGKVVASPVTGTAKLIAKAPQAIRNVRIGLAERALAKTKAAIGPAEAAIAKREALGKGTAFRSGMVDSMKKQVPELEGKIQRLQAKSIDAATKRQLKTDAKDLKGFGVKPGIGVKAPAPHSTGSESAQAGADAAATAAKPSGGGLVPALAASSIPSKADDAAKLKGADTAAKGADTATDIAKTESVTLKGSYDRMRDKGWKNLLPEEKQKLINAGVATVVGGRVLTGHGLVTGGEGII